MAEIKSAIELAMERTKGLVMDKEERASLMKKDLQSRVRAVLRRYQEEMTDREGLFKELGNIEGEAGMKREILLDILVDGFDIRADNQRIFDLFRFSDIGLDRHLGDELQKLQENFNREVEKRKKDINARIVARLGQQGIAGTGVEPNIEAWEEWNMALDEVADTFSAQLVAWKKKLSDRAGKR